MSNDHHDEGGFHDGGAICNGRECMSRGLGLLLLLAGSALLLDDGPGTEVRRSLGLAGLLVLIGSGLLLPPSKSGIG